MAKISNSQVRRRKVQREVPTKSVESVPSIVGVTPGEIKKLTGVGFGPPKTGKTTLAASGKNILLLEFDPQGDLTETLKGRKDITVVSPSSYSEVMDIITALKTTDKGRFDWVSPDSITFMFQLFGGKEIADVYINNKDIRRAYGRAGAMVSQIIHDLVVLPDTNVFFTAHLQREDGDDSSIAQDTELGEHEVRVAVTPMVWKILGPAVSFIGRTYKETVWEKTGNKKEKKTKYMVSFNDGDRSPAGSRLTMDGVYEIELDTLDKLYKRLVEGE